MIDNAIYKECESTPAATLEEHITNPCIPKNENEWWASREIERLRAENEKLREALIDAAAELEYAYIMSFKDQYRDAARAARKAVDSLQENKDEN